MISLSTKCIGQNSDLIVQLQDLPILENHFISQACESQLISTLPPLNLFVALKIYSKNNLNKFSKLTQCRYFSNWSMVGRSPQNIPLSQACPNNCLVTRDVPFRTAAIGFSPRQFEPDGGNATDQAGGTTCISRVPNATTWIPQSLGSVVEANTTR